jgi:hypothetical protein
MQMEEASKAADREFQRWKAELDARVKLRIAAIGKETSGDELLTAMGNDETMSGVSTIEQLASMQAQTMQAIAMLADSMNRPKTKQVVRGADGKVQGVIEQ